MLLYVPCPQYHVACGGMILSVCQLPQPCLPYRLLLNFRGQITARERYIMQGVLFLSLEGCKRSRQYFGIVGLSNNTLSRRSRVRA